jgi:hypothetical protein
MSFTTVAFASFGTSASVPLDLNNYDSNTVPGDSGFTNGFSIQFGTAYGDIRDFEENPGSGLTAYKYTWGSNSGKMHSDDSICPETSTSTQMTAVMEYARSRNTTSAAMNWYMGIRDTGAFGAFNYDFLGLNIVTNADGSVQVRPQWDDPGGNGFTGSFTTIYPDLSVMTAGAFVRFGFQQADDELYAWFEHLDGSNWTIWGPVTHSYTSGSAQTLNAATFSGQTHRRVTHIGDVASTGTDPMWIRNIAYYDGLYYGVGGTVVSAASMSLTGDTSVNAGSSHTYTVTIFDGSNDTATDYTGTVTWSQSASSVSEPSTYTFVSGDAGTKDFGNVIWYDAQETPSKFTVTDSASNISAGLSISIATVLASITISGDTTPQAGVNQVYTVTVFDTSGRTYADYTGTVGFIQSGSSLTFPSTYTFTGAGAGNDNGIQPVTGFVFYDAIETSRLTVYDTSRSTISAGLLISPIPGAPYYTQFDILSTAADLGETVSSVVTVTDVRGNVDTDYAGTLTLTSSATVDNVPASYTFTASENGVHTFTGWTFNSDGTQTVSVIDASDAPLTSRSTDSIYIRPAWRPPPTPVTPSYEADSRYTQIWQQVDQLSDGYGGIDFILRVEEQYPMVVSDVQPAYLIESGDTGRP